MTKILIVEDDLDLCETYFDMLEAQGFDVKITHNREDAMNQLTRFKPDAAILDMHLADHTSGVGVLALIRTHPSLKKTKVIIASGYDDIASWADQMYVADANIQKPVAPFDLLKVINDLLIETVAS